MNSSRYCTLLAAGIALSAVASQSQGEPSTPGYQVTKTVALGAPDRWDYVVFDAPSHRVYVAHGDRVSVVDGMDGSIVGQVEGYPGGTHGIAIAGAAGLGLTDDGRAGQVGVFDLKTFKTIRRIKADEDADAVVFDPVSSHAFSINGDSGTITVIDPRHETAVATVQAGGKLESAVVGIDGNVYINGAQNKEILRLNTNSNQIDARWSIANCTSPHGLAIDVAAHRLFASCANKLLVVVNTDSGAAVANLPIGSGTDSAAFDPQRKLIFSSNGRDGTLSIIQEKDPQTFAALGDLKTQVSARTMAIDPNSGRIYLVAGDHDTSAGTDAHAIVPGSLKLLFLDPPPAASAH
jgi:DNA-binding beta-propeller fold protein YncE